MQNIKIKNFIDNNMGYRGEIKFKFKPALSYRDSEEDFIYDIGDRIGQIIIMPYPKISFKEVDKLSSTERAEGGFGSTGE